LFIRTVVVAVVLLDKIIPMINVFTNTHLEWWSIQRMVSVPKGIAANMWVQTWCQSYPGYKRDCDQLHLWCDEVGKMEPSLELIVILLPKWYVTFLMCGLSILFKVQQSLDGWRIIVVRV
jgi:hypothetical protein